MAVQAHIGLPGAGKSHGLVENVVIPALASGRAVVHNLPLREDALAVVVGGKLKEGVTRGNAVKIPDGLDSAGLVEFCDQYPGAVLIIDEVWKYWGSGLKANEVPKPQMAFFKEHRHRVGADGMSGEVIIVDQALGSGVARFVRDLVDVTYVYTKLGKIGAKGMFRVDVYSMAQSLGQEKKSAHLRQLHGKYKPEVWNCYESHTQKVNKLGEAGLEVAPDKRASIWRSYQMRAAVVAVALMLPAAWWAYSAFWGMGGVRSKPSISSAVSAPEVSPGAAKFVRPQLVKSVAPGVAPRSAVSMVEPQESKRWTLAGVIVRPGAAVAILESATGTRLVALSGCKREVEWSCVVGGELVTAWTGDNFERMWKASTYSASMDQPAPAAQ